jgi:hypothetical protein
MHHLARGFSFTDRSLKATMLTSFVRRLFLFTFMTLCGAANAQTTVTLMQGLNGYAGSIDNAIAANTPTTNYGSITTYQLRAETANSLLVRFAIFAADGGPVPNDATITSATLSFYKYSGPAATFKASRLKRAWNESQATWNLAASGTTWQTAGAFGANDVEATADGQGSVGDALADGCSTSGPWPEACWLHIDVTAGVQAFRNGTPNHGWKLAFVSGPSASTNKSFNSTENTSWPTLRPKLTITYSSGCDAGSLRPYQGAPVNGTPIAVPASGATTIEAEHFNCGGEGVAYHDNAPGNAGNAGFRTTESVDIVTSSEGNAVNNFETGEWLTYTINVAQAGIYDLAIRASNDWPGAAFRLEIDGQDVTGSVAVSSTGSWNTFAWFMKPGVLLSAGQHVLKLVAVQQYFNVNQLQIAYVSPPPAECHEGTLRPYDEAPVNGNPIPVAASGSTIFEAEHFNCGGQDVAYHDNAAGNAGNAGFRTAEDVDIVTSSEGNAVNNFETGEWLTYTISVAQAGAYDLEIRAANNLAVASFRIEIDGVDATGSIAVQPTGGWETFAWIGKPSVNLSAGTHVLKLVMLQQYFNVNQLRITRAGTGGSGDCSAAGLTLCLRFEDSETQFGVPNNDYVTVQSLGSGVQFNVHTASDAHDTSRLALVNGGRDGSKALRFATLGNDFDVNGSGPNRERAELRLGTPETGASNGVEQWWAHSVFFPADFKVQADDPYWDSLFFQFHAESGGTQSNMALAVFQEPGTNRTIIRAASAGANGLQSDGRQYEYFVHGIHRVAGHCVEESFQRGVWYDFVHRMVWSDSGGGVQEMWLREAGGPVKKVLHKTGISNLHTGEAAYLKFGSYHHRLTPTGVSAVIHDRIRRGNSFAAVAMPDFALPSGGVVGCSY